MVHGSYEEIGKPDQHRNGDGMLMIALVELFQLFNQDAIDKAILSAYCL